MSDIALADTVKTTRAAAPEAVKPWQSKTLWAAVVVAAAPLIPGVGPIVASVLGNNPELAGAVVGGVFGLLRLVTKTKIAIK